MRGTRQRASSTANATRKRIASTSASETVPATFQCTFSNVTQKTLARKRKLVSCLMRAAPGGRASSSTRVRRETFVRHSSRERARRRACRPASGRAGRAARPTIPSTSSGATTTPAPASRISSRGGAVGRHDGEDRPLGREVLEHLAAEHALAAAARLRDQEQQRLGVALQLERAAARRVGDQLEPVAERQLPRPTRGRSSGSRRGSARRRRRGRDCCERGQERPRVALAEERARRA